VNAEAGIKDDLRVRNYKDMRTTCQPER